MHGIEILLVSVLAAFAQGSNSSKFTNWQSSWILHGKRAEKDEFPFMARLRNTAVDRHICGGTIISNWYVLTAAHCIVGIEKARFSVMVGSRHAQSGENYDVSATIPHPNYHPSQYQNDIGLVKVANAIVFKIAVQPVTLALRGNRFSVQPPCICMGWGYCQTDSKAFAVELRKAQLNVISNDECRKVYPYVTDAYICTAARRLVATSHGDEGGPLICNGKQVGVYSRAGAIGSPYGRPLPSVFVNVPKFRDWIYMVTSSSN